VSIGKHDGIPSRITTNDRTATANSTDGDPNCGANHLLKAIAGLSFSRFIELMILNQNLFT
jgi:hypothetical protein